MITIKDEMDAVQQSQFNAASDQLNFEIAVLKGFQSIVQEQKRKLETACRTMRTALESLSLTYSVVVHKTGDNKSPLELLRLHEIENVYESGGEIKLTLLVSRMNDLNATFRVLINLEDFLNLQKVRR